MIVFQSHFQKFLLFSWAITYQILSASIIYAEPYLPNDDSIVLQTLPASGNSDVQELRQLRNKLSNDPIDLALAVELAKKYLHLGHAMADPRYDGYAQAALQPWWNMVRPPPEVLLLRAILLQRRHDFNRALSDLDHVLQIQPYNSQAWLTQSVIHQVRGHYQDAHQSCLPLLRLSGALIAISCIANVASLNGHAQKSYFALQKIVESDAVSALQEKRWALTILAETATRLGKNSEAEQYFRTALAVDRRDVYLLGAYCDFLLDQGRAEEVQALLKPMTQYDGLLLRLALAEQQLQTPVHEKYVEELKARFAANRLRGEAQHLRDESRFTLLLLHQPKQALELAQKNWQIQREPWDARILLEAALQSGDRSAAQPVLDWLISVNLEDVQLEKLVKELL